MIDVKKMRTDAEAFQGRYLAISKEAVIELLDRLEAAERERDHYKALAETRWDGAIEANQMADALATHVEALKAAAYSEADGPGLRTNQQLRRVKALLDEGPDTASLARLKAQWQAEALERLRELLKDTHMDKAPTVSRAAMHVDDAINRIKQECAPLKLARQAKDPK